MPLKNDLDESRTQNEIMAYYLTENMQLILGEQYQRFELVVLILSEIMQKKYIDDETGVKLSRFLQFAANDATLGPVFRQIYDSRLTEEAQNRLHQALNFTG